MVVFKKIIDFETLREFCRYRVYQQCLNEDKKEPCCNKPDKRTMVECPIWKMLQEEKRLENEEWIEEIPKQSKKKFREPEAVEN